MSADMQVQGEQLTTRQVAFDLIIPSQMCGIINKTISVDRQIIFKVLDIFMMLPQDHDQRASTAILSWR